MALVSVSIDGELLAAVEQRCRELGKPVDSVVEVALEEFVAVALDSAPVEVPVFRAGHGPVAGIDLHSNRALQAALDGAAQTRGSHAETA